MSDDQVPYVIVLWIDAWADSVGTATVKDAHELHKAAKYETRGWLVVDNEEGLSVFPERCLDDGAVSYRGRTFIPRSLVKSVTPVKLSTKRKPKNVQVPPLPPPDAG